MQGQRTRPGTYITVNNTQNYTTQVLTVLPLREMVHAFLWKWTQFLSLSPGEMFCPTCFFMSIAPEWKPGVSESWVEAKLYALAADEMSLKTTELNENGDGRAKQRKWNITINDFTALTN